MNFKATFLLISMAVSFSVSAQLIDPKATTKRKVESRTNRKADETIDNGLDKLEDGLDNIFKKKDKKNKKDNSKPSTTSDPGEDNNSNDSANPSRDDQNSEVLTNSGSSLQRYSKSNFIAGEDVIAFEDFSNEQLGNLPGSWVSTGTAEVVKLEGIDGNWLWFNKTEGNFVPEYLRDFPEDFTLEFDMMFDFQFGTYSFKRQLMLVFSDMPNAEAKLNWNGNPGYFFLQNLGDNYTGIDFSAVGSDGGPFITGRKAVSKKSDLNFTSSYKAGEIINAKNINTPVHIAISRNGRRLQVYANEVKVLDMTNAFEPGVKLSSARFFVNNFTETDNYYLSNIRYAVGKPDVRNKILSSGNYSTSAITFNSGSAEIQPQSYAILKEIADALKSEPGKTVTIIGHTDSDGSSELNDKLSAKRAEAVKLALQNDFDVKNQISTEGKGASSPVAENSTAVGKAKNRRVEFQLK